MNKNKYIKETRRIIFSVLLSFMFFLQWGCTVHHTPKDLSIIPGSIQPFSVGDPVSIINAQTSSEEVLTTTFEYDFLVNYQQYTDVAIELMKNEIKKNGGRISEDASKSIRVSLVNLSLTKSLVRYRSIIDATVQLGNGKIQGHNARAVGHMEKAVDNSILNLVVSILNDSNVRSYLK